VFKKDLFRIRAVEDSAKVVFAKIAERLLSGDAPANPKAPIRSVLALRQDHLGDMILTVPALRALKRRLEPGGRLTIVASGSNAEFARLFFPEDRILVYGKYPWSRFPLFARLLWEKFDVAVDFHSAFSTTSALLILLSGAPLRVGYWTGGSKERLSRAVFNFGLDLPPHLMHESKISMRVVQRLRAGKDASPRIYAVPAAPTNLTQKVEAFFRQCGIGPSDLVLGIHPTLQKGSNCWAPENYLKLLRLLSNVKGLKTVVIHGRGEESALQRFMELVAHEGIEVHALPGRNVAYLLEAAGHFNLMVAGDSGLAHLMSLRTFVVEIFGPSEPDLWSPLGKHCVLRAKDHRCDSVEPRQVAEQVRKYIRRK
jgi:heptosyltransferase-2/heptosyltransferase-3